MTAFKIIPLQCIYKQENINIKLIDREDGYRDAIVCVDEEEFGLASVEHSTGRTEMGGYYYEYMWLHIPSDHTNAVGDSTDYIQEGFMVLLETNDPRTQSPESVFNEINNKILSGEAIETPIPDHHIYSEVNPDWITAVVNDFGTEINGPDNSWETMNKSFGDELLFDWAYEDVEITDNLDGWYTVEFVGEGIDAGKTVQFTDIEKLIFSSGSDAPLEVQVIDGPVIGSADWFESGGGWLGPAANQAISYDENNVEFRIEGDTVKVIRD